MKIKYLITTIAFLAAPPFCRKLAQEAAKRMLDKCLPSANN